MRFEQTVFLIILSALAVGCPSERQASSPAATTEQAEKSTGQQAIEGFTGKTAIDAGRRAEQTLNRISIQRDKDYEELVGNEE